MISWGKLIWIVLFISSTGYLVWFEWTTGDREASIVLGYLLLLLTFPSGLVLTILVVTVGGWLISALPTESQAAHRIGSDVVQSVMFFVVGYWQWFVLVPRWRARMRGDEQLPEERR